MADGEGVSILETESYTLALVFLIFLAVFITVEKLIKWRQAVLTRRHKVGLLAALDAVKVELMLFGLASLLLKVLESPITSICIPVPSTYRWTMLSQLNGCECCLRHTKAISECFLDHSGCGANFCNCNNANSTCLADQEASSAEAAGIDTEGQCAGFTQYKVKECGYRPGYKQALTSRTIGQIHTMLFYIAAVHIVCSVVMHKIASARIHIWYKWLSVEDAHSTAVNMTLQQFAEAAVLKEQRRLQAKDVAQGPGKLRVWRSLKRSFSRSDRTSMPDVSGGRAAQPDAPEGLGAPPPPPTSSLEGPSPRASAGANSDHAQSVDTAHGQQEGGAASASREDAKDEALNGGENGHDQQSAGKPTLLSGGHVLAAVQSQIKPGPGHILHDAVHMLVNAHVPQTLQPTAGGEARPSHQSALPQTEIEMFLADEAADEASAEAAAAEVPDEAADGPPEKTTTKAVQGAAPREQDHTAVDIQLPDEVVVQRTRRWTGRGAKLDRDWEHSWEWITCFLCQFRMQTIQPAEISIMRASFILTHRPGRKFNFMNYILASLDDDCAKVVGLGWTIWLVVIVFVLLAGVVGWSAAWFELVALVLELIMNTKLIHIARHTARGGAVHRLKPTIFWFGANGPWVMLLAIKTLLFLVSFIFASLIFFAVNFGPKSCFFSTPGLNTASLPIPWWAILIVNVMVYCALSFVTLPLYSLGVQMGSGFRPHILSPNVKNRLLDIAHANKEKARQRRLESQEGKYRSKFRKLSGRMSAVRWRRKHLSNRPA